MAAVDPQSVATVWPLVPQGSIYGIGETNAIAWTNNVTNPLTAPIVSLKLELGTVLTVDLNQGAANAVTTLYTVATVAWPATSCYQWTPSATLTAGNTNYTFIFSGLDKNGGLVATNYCTWFNLAANGTTGYPAATTCDNINTNSGLESPVATSAAKTTTAATVATTKSNGALIALSAVTGAFAFALL
ncbi:UNVERIFIED_CONTAM: hypothetical protein HDU68_009021 [Siphonaria sp. JEL0065]|nr:hypothetical protein HDU68_009021 [Siphonaria sp. JEL0065]